MVRSYRQRGRERGGLRIKEDRKKVENGEDYCFCSLVTVFPYSSRCLPLQINVVDYLRGKLKLKADEELLHSITGILDVNCHEVRSSIPGEWLRGGREGRWRGGGGERTEKRHR